MPAKPATHARVLVAMLASVALVVASAASATATSTGARATSSTTGGVSAAPPPKVVDGLGDLTAGSGPIDVVVQLPQQPAAVTWKHEPKATRTSAGRAQKAKIDLAQKSARRAISRLAGAKVLYSLDSAYNGIAVHVDRKRARALLSIPGVSAVRRLTPVTLDNASSDALIGAPGTWSSGLTGAGVRIGIIDTGIDYTHSDFGGSGNPANNPNHTILGDGTEVFPNAKVAGGYDFAGDAYNASTGATPNPDPDPEDCNGHGSHVAGTAAGYGENGDGSTYTGPYDASTKLTSLKIGPGVAPGAQLYALKVFGCSGSTNLIPEALDWAMDPNNDGDFSDHLDVVNMSLGSNFGDPDSADAVASDNAALVGVQVVIAAGNNGNLAYTVGSPGTSTRSLTVASSVNAARVLDAMTFTPDGGSPVRYPGTNSITFAWSGHPDVTAPLYVPTDRIGCTPFSGGDLTGAAGHVLLLDLFNAPAPAPTPCGSAARVTNAFAAGAVGVVLADRGTAGLTTSLTGAATIPSFLVSRSSADALLASVPIGTSGGSVTLGATPFGAGPLIDPAADALSSFSSRGPSIGNALKPDISAPGENVLSVSAGSGNGSVSESGTSMATPHMAGVMALLKQLHPTWSVEELKALAMNTAGQDLWSQIGYKGNHISPVSQGSGRVELLKAVQSDVVAYDTDDPGAVSVSFGSLQVLGTQHVVRTLAVVNHGTTDATYQLAQQRTTTVPGISYDFLDGPSVTVPAGGTASVRLQLTAVGSAMDNSADVNLNQATVNKTVLSEDAGLVTLTPAAGVPLRVAYLAVVRPASAMAATDNVGFTSSAPGTATLHLAGTGVASGVRPYLDDNSLVTPLQLGGTSARDPLLPAAADLRNVGEAVAGPTLVFGVQTFGTHSLPTAEETEVDINLDVDNDGVDDFILYNTRSGASDIFISGLYRISNGSAVVAKLLNVVPTSQPTALLNSDVLTLGVSTAALGMTAGTTLRYSVQTYHFGVAADQVGPFTFDVAHPALDFTGGAGAVMWPDQPGATIPVAYDPAAWAAQGQPSVLLLHHFNLAGSTGEIVPAGPAVTSVEVSPSPASLAHGTTAQLTATALLLDGSHQDVTALADWSSDSANATVGNSAADKGLLTGASEGTANVSASYLGVSASTAVTVTAATLATVAVTPAITSLAKGTTQQYTATGTFTDGSTQDLTSTATWTTDDLGVATVDATGLLTGAGVGSTDVTATVDGHSGSASVSVTPAVLTSIVVSPVDPSIAQGTSVALQATGVFSDSTTQDLTNTATWVAATPAVAFVDSSGLVTGATTGTSTVSAVQDGITGSTVVTVTSAVVTSVAITPAGPTLPAGTDQQLTATATLSDSSTQDVTADVTWASGTPAHATVSNASGSAGVLHGVAAGTSHLTATLGAVVGSTDATVTAAVLHSLAVSPTGASLPKGATLQYTATGTFTDGSTQDLTTAVTWGSSTAAASVSNAAGSQGLATGLATGPATISATSGAISGSTGLTVTAAGPVVLSRIAVTPANASTPKGTQVHYVATGTYSNGTTRVLTSAVTWRSSGAAVSISNRRPNNGRANALSLGTVTISATLGSVTGSTSLTVTPAVLRSLSVTPKNTKLKLGTSRQYVATGTYTDGTTQPLTSSVVWSVTGGVTLSATRAGYVTAVRVSTASVTATLSGLHSTVTFSVTR